MNVQMEPMEVPAEPEPGSGYPPKEWPSSPARYWALFAIIFATFITFFDQTVFGMLAEQIKKDFGLTDGQLGFLGGPASIICYLFVGIPLARLADIWPRKYVLSARRRGGRAGHRARRPRAEFRAVRRQPRVPRRGRLGACPFLLFADRRRLPARASSPALFALLQFGFIGGLTLGTLVGGQLIAMTAHWETSHVFGLTIFGWQWILIMDRRARPSLPRSCS